MIKSIVAALDGSEASLAGLKQAAFLAGRLGAELRGVYVESDAPFKFFPSYSETKGQRAKVWAEDQRYNTQNPSRIYEEDLRAHFKKTTAGLGVPPVLHILKGRVNEMLVQEGHGADMLVLGHRGGKGGPTTESLGSITEMVIHELQRPVLVVPPGGELQGPALLAFDGSRGVQRVLMAGLELVSVLGGPLTVLNVNDHRNEGSALLDSVRPYIAPYRVPTEYVTEPGERKADALILARARTMGAGLLIMGAYDLKPIREFFFGSVTRSVLAQATCPVLLTS